jgi:ferrochelatase
MSEAQPYDALLLVSFGGPERREDVIPFLENVLRGRNVPRERMLAVAEHYYLFDGKTPINDQNRALIDALTRELSDLRLPIYWGNRNWHPLLADTLRQMSRDGVRRALAFVTSAFSSYSSCRQYRENIAHASTDVQVDKLRVFYNHPGFIEAMVERCREALFPGAQLVFTAHSIPVAMARTSRYEEQLNESCRLVADRLGLADWRLVFQSRSGSPSQPWLAPDILDYLKELGPGAEVVLAPIGFLSDHMEVIYDLDTEARALCEQLGIRMARAATVGVHPRFVSMIRELVMERICGGRRLALGDHGPSHDVCPEDCCPGPSARTQS